MMEPATSIISRLGGPAVVADGIGVHRTRVSNWKRPREKGGTDGKIPQKRHRTLIDFARSKGVEITADDLLGLRGVVP